MRPWANSMLMGALLSPVVAQASPSSLSVSGGYTGGAFTTGSTTVSVLSGPSGSYTYAWALLSGSGITCNSPSSQTTTFSGTPGGENTTLSATYRCTVTSVATGQSTHVDVPISIHAGLAALVVNASPGSLGTSHSAGSDFTIGCSVSLSNGSAPFTYSWSCAEGSMSPTSGSASSILDVPPGAAGTGTICDVNCHVTDALGRTGTGESVITVNWT